MEILKKILKINAVVHIRNNKAKLNLNVLISEEPLLIFFLVYDYFCGNITQEEHKNI